jgi:pantoate--beta-alanine ligase
MNIVGVKELREALGETGLKSIGFVATMGALHEGHLSLMRRARAENDVVVASIFVNPLQFRPNEDFEAYPRDLEGDSAKAAEADVDFILAPQTHEIYPQGEIATRIDPGPIGQILEGHFRPGFFTGVATVCVKLFNIVQPYRAYFGEKDAQQLAVIRQVVRDLNLPIEVVGCPTVREPDGLAMSSRNAYLDAEARKAATVLSAALFEAKDLFDREGETSAEILKKTVTERITGEERVRLQYVEVVDRVTFQPVETVDAPAVIALAAFLGETRLIDNVVLEGRASGRE